MRTLIHTLFFLLLLTQLCFAQWVRVGLNDKSIMDIAVQNSTIFVVTSDSGKVYRSFDNGVNWIMVVDSNAVDIAITQSGKVFMVKDSMLNANGWVKTKSKLFVSLDNGDTWSDVNIVEQLIDSIQGGPRKLTISPSGNVFCYIYNMASRDEFDYIAKSTDDGVSWTTPGPSIIGGNLFDFRSQFVITIGHVSYYLCCSYTFIHLSSDYGNTWNYIGDPPDGFSYTLGFFSNRNILAGGKFNDSLGFPLPSIILTTDTCSNWTQISSLNTQTGLSWSNGLLEGMLIGTDIGVFLFSDEGDSLGSRNEGLTNLNVQALMLDEDEYVYAGTGNGVWRRPLSEVTVVVEHQMAIPSNYILEQNFPNPFNPSTTFRYLIPTQSKVIIKVYDVLGNEIETLFNEEKSFGTYELTWHAANLPSGVYFYQLKAGEFIDTKKMILLK